ncbi:MAG: hypothetical protein GWP25_07505 [Euryarchaeota archaeon]|nr:hypothetical protein [Euryarchaeota archaeon]
MGDGDLAEPIIDENGLVVIPEPMTVENFTAFMSGVDDGDLTPLSNISKAGTQIIICCTIDLGEEIGEPMENTTMTMTSMYDQDLQRMMTSTSLTVTGVDEAGVVQTETFENTRIEGAAPNGSSHEGIVNLITSETDESGEMTGNLIKYFAFDWVWDWDIASEDILDDNDDVDDEDSGHSFVCRTVAGDPDSAEMEVPWEKLNDGTEDCGDGADEPQDFDGDGFVDNSHMCFADGTTVTWDKINDGTEDCDGGDDEGILPDLSGADSGIFPDFEIDDEVMVNGTWALVEIVDITTGEVKFVNTMVDNLTILISVLPTTPPTVTSMVVYNDTMSMSTYFMFGDDVVINLVDSEGDGWMRGATDMMIGYDEPCYFSDCSDGEYIEGWMAIDEDDQWLEAPNENLYLHIMGPEPDSPPPTAAEAMENDTDGDGHISWSEFVYAWEMMEEDTMTLEESDEFSMLFNESDMYYLNESDSASRDDKLNMSELQIFIDKMEMMFGPPEWHCSSTVGGAPDMTISFELVNDGTEDCGDGSDEPQDFDGDGVTDNWFDCMDDAATNISMDDVNDGWEDCGNGADEIENDWGDEGDSDFVVIANISISGLLDVDEHIGDTIGCDSDAFTDDGGAVWIVCWSDVNNNGLVDHPDIFNISTTDATDGSFEVRLYDADAGDYAGSMMPGFSGLLTCVAMLGACLFIRRKE